MRLFAPIHLDDIAVILHGVSWPRRATLVRRQCLSAKSKSCDILHGEWPAFFPSLFSLCSARPL